MIAAIIQLIIVLIIVGVLYWAYTQLIGFIPLPPPIRRIIDVLIVIILVLIIVFYVLIPIIEMIGHALPAAGIH